MGGFNTGPATGGNGPDAFGFKFRVDDGAAVAGNDGPKR